MTEVPVTDWSESSEVGQFTITRRYPDGGGMTAVEFGLAIMALVDKARALVELMEDAEVNHGGLVGTKTLRARNELRLELSKW